MLKTVFPSQDMLKSFVRSLRSTEQEEQGSGKNEITCKQPLQPPTHFFKSNDSTKNAIPQLPSKETGMALLNLNPLYTVTLPILFLFSLPVALFACLTTILAFNVLLFRVSLIYIDLAAAVIPYYLLGITPNPSIPEQKSATPPQIPSRRRRRRSSSNLSTGSLTPNALGHSSSVVGLTPTRDFEGVGGWRLRSEEQEEEEVWTKINSRLELPAEHGRRHRRSATGGLEMRGREEGNAMVMNSGRARTPPVGREEGYGYFGMQRGSEVSSKVGRRTASAGTASSSSKGSSGLSMKAR
ncbi:hypothetical protein LARI1_G004930 [Lachnellula arida]|uniref:Uncharacterized protein n=1 Tax=Lachnellula arida TaxID=1316785 RepID=A0A8T9B7N7_9HELO|nr:hypothetical protein LARI1_G004930 [Lachnellula arida]